MYYGVLIHTTMDADGPQVHKLFQSIDASFQCATNTSQSNGEYLAQFCIRHDLFLWVTALLNDGYTGFEIMQY